MNFTDTTNEKLLAVWNAGPKLGSMRRCCSCSLLRITLPPVKVGRDLPAAVAWKPLPL